jgi:hypothetical protein
MESARKSQFYLMRVRTPIPLIMAIRAATGREMCTTSEFVRRAVIERLRADGISIANPRTRKARASSRLQKRKGPTKREGGAARTVRGGR